MIARNELRIKEAVDLFLDDRADYYDSGNGPTRQLCNMRSGLERWVVRLAGNRWISELDAIMLDNLLRQWVSSGRLGRTSINRNLSFVRQLMKFCVRRGYARAEQFTQIMCVDRLRQGRYGITEPEPVRPVDEQAYRASLAFLAPTSRSIVELLFLTGMRPGEVRLMLVEDLGLTTIRSRRQMLYVPHRHKTAHLAKRRAIPLMGAARAIVECQIRTVNPISPGYVFSSDGAGFTAMPENRLGKNIREACERAGVDRWQPMQLRHRFGTVARAGRIKMESIAGLMGHTNTRTTEIYAEATDVELIRTMGRLFEQSDAQSGRRI